MIKMKLEQIDKSEFRKFLKDNIIKGQKCQRNWDLDKPMPQEDIDLVVAAATQCPSKQNLDFYSVMVIQDQEIQKKIYENTLDRPGGRYNPQVLANLLLLFFPKIPSEPRNAEVLAHWAGVDNQNIRNRVDCDRDQAIGVAAGFVNVISQFLGYSTGCNKCFNEEAIKDILNVEEKPLLMMGVGWSDETRNRREDHMRGDKITSHQKLPIEVTYV